MFDRILTIKTEAAHTAFHSMAEGMWEVARDDNVSPDGDPGIRAGLLERLIGTTPYFDGVTYPLTFQLPPHIAATAKDVIDNMEDNETPDVPEYNFLSTDIALSEPRMPSHEMGVQEALEEALIVLQEQAAETDTASPEGWRARCAIETITALIAQRGCEHFGEGDKLTDLCDVVIFG